MYDIVLGPECGLGEWKAREDRACSAICLSCYMKNPRCRCSCMIGSSSANCENGEVLVLMLEAPYASSGVWREPLLDFSADPANLFLH